jgi:hypothetical protein
MGEDEVIETMKDRLKSIQQERWQRFEYVHDESEAAWEAYNEGLFLDTNKTNKAAADDTEMQEPGSTEDKGKGKQALTVEDDSAEDEKLERLVGDWGEEDLLRALGGQDDLLDDNNLAAAAHSLDINNQGAARKIKEEAVDAGKGLDTSAAKRRPGRPAKEAAAAAPAQPKSGARARGSTRGAAIQID